MTTRREGTKNATTPVSAATERRDVLVEQIFRATIGAQELMRVCGVPTRPRACPT